MGAMLSRILSRTEYPEAHRESMLPSLGQHAFAVVGQGVTPFHGIRESMAPTSRTPDGRAPVAAKRRQR
jgi:hypothetical protein